MGPSTIIIGAGQAGLAAAHALEQRSVDCLILDRTTQIGSTWRERWDSLRLFTPAAHDGLPGLPFPARSSSLPRKDDVADYLVRYAATVSAPVSLATAVTRVYRTDAGFIVETSSGQREAASVILATGTHPVPLTPELAGDLTPGIVQIHSAQYRNPDGVPSGKVLVVGSGTSGIQIALDLAKTHDVTVAGRPTAHIPDAIFRYAGGAYWAFAHRVLTTATPIGRKVAATFHDRSAPLISVSPQDLDVAGVRRVGRIVSAKDGQPITESGEVLAPNTVIWATGYRPGLDWIDDLPVNRHGWPVSNRGVIDALPGLYTVGFPFQFGLTSGLIGGVGRDAAYVADAIQAQLAGNAQGFRTSARRNRIPRNTPSADAATPRA
ncbi:flavin-containing monooxygenase [Mycetocola zhadangensis]|uniref:flavin-containing monooxygenase n=1 Tax=Mycetocola zhadangensis TaxID=1164595 RepID=UPI003A4DC57A